MLKEFKNFALRGNVLDLAIGMVMGSAFTAIVTSLVNDLIMPLIGLLIGGIDLSGLYVALDGNSYASLLSAQEAGAPVWNYGAFIMAIINFFVIALALFLVMKVISKFFGKKDEDLTPAIEDRKCPYCFSVIADKASRCPHCTSELPELDEQE